ncbi:Oidioi.mRNA.OKI2018_I69.PAR.g11291.t1.cds [Oikopleura dioica]|uniref:Oidioi.mRNA.OKI2018_I69.PAR.g11291.t1.cds n=1 Tax=Oikopleura dioica TaxID=34765 RepID=A0ABN7RUY8_OIKDI|nr:Oidioi.mRNA.OKI2018_I69.PAR.g11291.t1.cds [Oikopleura dioica]
MSDSLTFAIKFDEKSEGGHTLFIREHKTRVEEAHRPTGRTIIVCNIPPWCPKNSIKANFVRFGKIQDIQLQLKPGKKPEEEEDTRNRFSVAYIVYAEEASIEKLKKTANAKKTKTMYASTVEHTVITGYPLFCAEYNQSFPDIKKLQTEINEFMANFDEKKTEEEMEAEDGWQVAGKKKFVRLTEAEQNEMKKKVAKKRKKDQQLNFYSFQIRESKKNKIVEMRKKFEEDKKKINRMKQERKFKPVAS